jgi:hypothetical protein
MASFFRPVHRHAKARRPMTEMQRGIFTKIRQGNPAKASSDAVNPKPGAFIGR